MKNKISKLVITILTLAIPSVSYSQIDKASAIQVINEFKEEKNSDKLLQCLSKIEREPSFNEILRAELLVQVLAAAVEYLEKHPKPVGTPQINIAPTDGSIPGTDPASIKDPVVRAQYEKDIAANKALAEAHCSHSSISAVRDKLITYSVLFTNIKPENNKLFTDFLKTASSNPETVKTVAALMKKKESEKTPQPTGGSIVPK